MLSLSSRDADSALVEGPSKARFISEDDCGVLFFSMSDGVVHKQVSGQGGQQVALSEDCSP